MLSSPTQHFTALKNLFKGAVGAIEPSLTNSFMQHYKNSYKYVVVYNLKFWWQRTATIRTKYRHQFVMYCFPGSRFLKDKMMEHFEVGIKFKVSTNVTPGTALDPTNQNK